VGSRSVDRYRPAHFQGAQQRFTVNPFEPAINRVPAQIAIFVFLNVIPFEVIGWAVFGNCAHCCLSWRDR